VYSIQLEFVDTEKDEIDEVENPRKAIVQVADLKSINRLITDDSLPVNMRLDLAKMGIKLTLANT
jgi:hypothetical protein